MPPDEPAATTTTTRIYGDLLSQPTRAVLVFARASGIAQEHVRVNLGRGEQLREPYARINPLKMVPLLQEVDAQGRSFMLPESCTSAPLYLFLALCSRALVLLSGGPGAVSCATPTNNPTIHLFFPLKTVMRYLASTRPNVPPDFYPADPRRRAEVEAASDWHHSVLRFGASRLVFGKVFGPLAGRPSSPEREAEAAAKLSQALDQLENYWLRGERAFVGGGGGPSVADLSCACEVEQLRFLGPAEWARLVEARPRVAAWRAAVERALAPHYADVHAVVHKLAARLGATASNAAHAKL